MLDLLARQATVPPQPPSQRIGKPISADLEGLILKCLAKTADQRPATASELADLLDRCAVAEAWTTADAQVWWDEFELRGVAGISISPTGTVSGEATVIKAPQEIQTT
jgi:hypothetical protein